MDILKDRKVTSVISDMAPNAIGQKGFDHDAIIQLQSTAFNFAKQVLQTGGYFLCKIWYGDNFQDFMEVLKKDFEKVKIVKPPASRVDSAEVYFFAEKYRKNA